MYLFMSSLHLCRLYHYNGCISGSSHQAQGKGPKMTTGGYVFASLLDLGGLFKHHLRPEVRIDSDLSSNELTQRWIRQNSHIAGLRSCGAAWRTFTEPWHEVVMVFLSTRASIREQQCRIRSVLRLDEEGYDSESEDLLSAIEELHRHRFQTEHPEAVRGPRMDVLTVAFARAAVSRFSKEHPGWDSDSDSD